MSLFLPQNVKFSIDYLGICGMIIMYKYVWDYAHLHHLSDIVKT